MSKLSDVLTFIIVVCILGVPVVTIVYFAYKEQQERVQTKIQLIKKLYGVDVTPEEAALMEIGPPVKRFDEGER
jgi:hypothetical protein